MKLKNYLSKYGLRAGIAVLIIAVIVVAVSASRGGRAGLLRDASGSLRAPVQKAADALVNWAENFYGYLYEYDRLVEENNSLKAEISQLREQARNFEEVENENERLRRLTELREKHSDFVFESAKIVAWDSSNYTSAFTVSKGSNQGLELGDCVVTEYGAVVGQVVELGESWATIRTIVDVDMDLGALVGAGSYAGVVTGEFALMKRELTRVSYLASGAQMFAGDEVLTSGSGGTFPPGLLIGTISAIVTEAGGQTTYGILEPACSLGMLSQVFVIKDFEIVE